jgi:signal transduction histidine kinase
VENPQIKVEVYDLKDSIQLLYSDNGVGMDNHTINHIFEPFFTTKRGEGGSGLGLSIVYNLITTLLKGKISCESNPMAGTIFTIIIKKEVDS